MRQIRRQRIVPFTIPCSFDGADSAYIIIYISIHTLCFPICHREAMSSHTYVCQVRTVVLDAECGVFFWFGGLLAQYRSTV